jgi:hypothetical protein
VNETVPWHPENSALLTRLNLSLSLTEKSQTPVDLVNPWCSTVIPVDGFELDDLQTRLFSGFSDASILEVFPRVNLPSRESKIINIMLP